MTKTNPTILITGASSGIGQAVSLDLAQRGYQVWAGVRREQDGAALKKQNPSIHPVLLDVTDSNHLQGVVDELTAHCQESGGLAGLINNAGIVVAGPMEAMTLETLKGQFEVNLFGAVELTRLCLPLIRLAKGRIINIGSIAGRVASPFIGPYAMSKSALAAFSTSLRRELRSEGLRVSLIEPGAVATPIWQKSSQAAQAQQKQWSQEIKDRFEGPTFAMKKAAEKLENQGMDVQVVVRAVRHAVSAKRPKARYLLGREARLQNLANLILPDFMMDALIARFLKLKK